jgi:ribonuclease D
LHNEVLIAAARDFVAGKAEVPRHLNGSRRSRFLGAAEQALQLPESEWPRLPRKTRIRPTPAQQSQYNDFKQKRDRVAAELHLDPSLIAPKAALEAIAFNPDGVSDKLMPWQRTLLGIEG